MLCTFWPRNVLRATTRASSTPQVPKVVWTCCALNILTWKCALRRNGVHFLNISTSLPTVAWAWGVFTIVYSTCASRHSRTHFFESSTSKNSPKLRCFKYVDFEMGFAPGRRALSRRLNLEHEVSLAFGLQHVLRATAACSFGSLIRPDGSAPAALAGDTKHRKKHGVSQLFCLFAHLDLHFSDSVSSVSFSSLIALTTVAASVHEPEACLLNFLRLDCPEPLFIRIILYESILSTLPYL